jgi:hypothetical protein
MQEDKSKQSRPMWAQAFALRKGIVGAINFIGPRLLLLLISLSVLLAVGTTLSAQQPAIPGFRSEAQRA